MLLILLRKRAVKLGGWSVNLPTPAMTALQLCVGLADIFLVSSVLYLLLPASWAFRTCAFLGAYLASMLAGVLSHVPAGLGVLESMLLLLLPDVPPEQLLAAVLMYRVIYEIIPVLLALALWGTFEGFSRDGVLLRAVRPSGTEPCGADRPDHRQERVSQAAAALEGGFDARRDAPVAAGARTHLFVDQARQAERLLHQRVTPAMRVPCTGCRQLAVRGCPRTPAATGCAASVCIQIDVLARPSGRRVHHPALRLVRAARLARVARGPDDRSAGPAARIGARVDRRIEREHAGPARRHPHVGDVPKRAAMRTEQRICLRCGHRDRHGTKHASAGRSRSAVPNRAGSGSVRARRCRSGCRCCARAGAPARSCPAGRSTSPRSARATRGRPP